MVNDDDKDEAAGAWVYYKLTFLIELSPETVCVKRHKSQIPPVLFTESESE